ncbi:MAG TPA: hypothetical protein VIX89_13555 [Bryobacteraceae bacterium]
MTRLWRNFGFIFIACSVFGLLKAQPVLTCQSTAVPPIVAGEGITERIGDIVMSCTGGTPGAQVTGNFSVFLNVNITNHVSGNTVTDVVFTVDNGSGPQPVNTPGMLVATNQLVYNGLSYTLSSMGSALLRIANIRAAANLTGLGPNHPINAFLSFNLTGPPSTNSQLLVATAEPALLASFSSKIVCAPNGSPLSDNPASFASFLASRSIFNSTRVTEGFADAFNPRSAPANLNANSGTRVIVHYSGFPNSARLFVPDVIAGSDAVQPTAAGDFGLVPSGGRYAPTGIGSLLLARVVNTDANGAGGSVVYVPGPPGSGVVSLDSMRELTIVNGQTFAVYEVVDADPHAVEFAQFPTVLGLAAGASTGVQTFEDVSLAPVSTVYTASSTDPIPRYQAIAPATDCNLLNDCGASYFPKLFVDTTPMQFTAQAGSNFQVAYTRVNNQGGGNMLWNATVRYTNGSGWLRVDPTSGINNATIRVDALPANLTAGIYNATLTVDAGPVAGSRVVPITLTVNAAPPPAPSPAVTTIVNGASFAPGFVAPGSIATIFGTKFMGASVGVTFDAMPAKILFAGDTQLNVMIPMELGARTSAKLVVTVDGMSSAAQGISLAPFAPAIFKNGILNQDYSLNVSGSGARPGTVIQIFATGLAGDGAITAKIGDLVIPQPNYGGPAPGLIGVQQVNVALPSDLTGPTANVSVCGVMKFAEPVCSPAVQVMLAQ